jgi:hydrocephalus-inducing protein
MTPVHPSLLSELRADPQHVPRLFLSRYTREVCVTNTSTIPMDFAWHIQQQGPDARELSISPAAATIPPHGKQVVSLEWMSTMVQQYEVNLIMDLPGIQTGAASLVVKGECAVPKISLLDQVLSFGDCFLDYPYEKSFVLLNDSKLPGKFEILSQVREGGNLFAR